MTDDQTVAKLRAILGDIAPDLDIASIGVDADLRNDVGLDSMDFLNFVIGAHKQLGVDTPEADYGKVNTLAKFARYVAARQAAVPPTTS